MIYETKTISLNMSLLIATTNAYKRIRILAMQNSCQMEWFAATKTKTAGSDQEGLGCGERTQNFRMAYININRAM